MNHNQSNLPGEAALVQGLLRGDENAFAGLYEKFSGALFGKISAWINDPSTAENLLQDVFVKAWRCRHQYDENKGRLFTWLYNISRNLCIDHYRSRSRKKNGLVTCYGDPDIFSGEKYMTIPVTDRIGLRKLVRQLRKEESEVIDLMYFEGFTQSEIAKSLNIPIGTVKTRVTAAIRKLRKFFDGGTRLDHDLSLSN